MRAYFDLVRVFLTPTALADCWTGYFLAAQIAKQPPRLSEAVLLSIASVALYWFGMTTNDLLDMEKDRATQARRPLVTAAVSRRSATLLAGVLAVVGLGVPVLLGIDVAIVAAAVLSLAVLYNAGAKHLPVVGNVLMGSCRAGNLLLGAAAVLDLNALWSEPELLWAAALLGFYIMCVTAVSVLEDEPPHVASFVATASMALIAPLAGLVSPWDLRPPTLAAIANAAALETLVAVAIVRGAISSRRHAAAIGCDSRDKGPHPAERFVRTTLSFLFLIDAGSLLRREHTSGALMLYGLMILAWLWKVRWLQSRP